MQIHSTINGIRAALDLERGGSNRVGFVPTMGALHVGHLSLIERAKTDCDTVVLSIFVNPLQFGTGEDLDKYPRPIEADLRAAEAAEVDHVFCPTASEMYPDGAVPTRLTVPSLSTNWEGARRPGHFDGMATVVAKLLNIVGPCSAYFGEKDWQQLSIIKRFVRDLSMPIEVVGCPIMREPDGLAMSSRNIYLDAEERNAALSLSRALFAAVNFIHGGARAPEDVRKAMYAVLAREPLVEPFYAAAVDDLLTVPSRLSGQVRLLIAAKVGSTSLIDNIGVDIS